jgi:hypothetical protein
MVLSWPGAWCRIRSDSNPLQASIRPLQAAQYQSSSISPRHIGRGLGRRQVGLQGNRARVRLFLRLWTGQEPPSPKVLEGVRAGAIGIPDALVHVLCVIAQHDFLVLLYCPVPKFAALPCSANNHYRDVHSQCLREEGLKKWEPHEASDVEAGRCCLC